MLRDEGVALGAIVVLVDEAEIIGRRKAQQPQAAGLGKPAPGFARRCEMAAMDAEALLLQLAPRDAELARSLDGVGDRLLEKGNVVEEAEIDPGRPRELAACLGPETGEVQKIRELGVRLGGAPRAGLDG